ncbi:MAG: DUF488 domain-containing protein [Bacteroidia bacterium]|nr:DUF488 domain-containing protein [Bacteroidia bacterium]MCO5253714.1 DUF488 domain-containing protein [Bacteroidota bacterium]MCZ2129158.1 DUF488 domain-containing protein [Bacteroidia bacterium]
MSKIIIKRVYESATKDDGYRILVDRLWPRGISKDHAQIKEWLKELGPSTELRKWFNHDPALYPEFKKKYIAELHNQKTELKRIADLTNKHQVCLVYGAKDEKHNQAVVLKEAIEHI